MPHVSAEFSFSEAEKEYEKIDVAWVGLRFAYYGYESMDLKARVWGSKDKIEFRIGL